MADIELVIKIPEELYETLKNPEILSTMYHASRAADAVRNGTPLPKKGHGDLIDRNDLLEYTDINRCAYTPTINRYDIITTPTIIEADKGVLEKINEKQDSLRATCKAWDEATEKDGYVN